MLRQERTGKSATKALAKAAAKPGHLRLTSLFDVRREPQTSTRTSHGANTEEATFPTFVEQQQGSQNQTQQSNETAHVKDPWVENANDFANVDMEESERSERYFQREWLRIYKWLIFNRETNKAFCKTCVSYLISHLYTLKTLLRQGVPIRGNTIYESNIYQFDLDKARSDKGLNLLLDEKHYVTVHDVLMEQEQMLVLHARRP